MYQISIDGVVVATLKTLNEVSDYLHGLETCKGVVVKPV